MKNITTELYEMVQDTEKLQACNSQLVKIKEEAFIRLQTVKLYCLMGVVSLLTIVMVVLKLAVKLELENFIYLIIAVVAAVGVYMVVRSFKSDKLEKIGNCCMAIAAWGSIAPAFPELMKTWFEESSNNMLLAVRVSGILLLLIGWILILTNDRNRSKRLDGIWDSLNGL